MIEKVAYLRLVPDPPKLTDPSGRRLHIRAFDIAISVIGKKRNKTPQDLEDLDRMLAGLNFLLEAERITPIRGCGRR